MIFENRKPTKKALRHAASQMVTKAEKQKIRERTKHKFVLITYYNGVQKTWTNVIQPERKMMALGKRISKVPNNTARIHEYYRINNRFYEAQEWFFEKGEIVDHKVWWPETEFPKFAHLRTK